MTEVQDLGILLAAVVTMAFGLSWLNLRTSTQPAKTITYMLLWGFILLATFVVFSMFDVAYEWGLTT